MSDGIPWRRSTSDRCQPHIQIVPADGFAAVARPAVRPGASTPGTLLLAGLLRVGGGLNLSGAPAISIELTNACLACDAGPALRGDGLAAVMTSTAPA